MHARFGANQQLRIYQDGSSGNSEILHNASSFLTLRSDKLDLRPKTVAGAVYLRAAYNGSVYINYANSKKFETSGVGVTITDQLDVTNINASGIITAVDGNFTGNVSIGGTLSLIHI